MVGRKNEPEQKPEPAPKKVVPERNRPTLRSRTIDRLISQLVPELGGGSDQDGGGDPGEPCEG